MKNRPSYEMWPGYRRPSLARRWMLIASASLALALLPACTPDDGGIPRGAVTTFDSAGIVVVSATGSTWEESDAWRISPDPVLRIGAVSGEPEKTFGFVADASRLTDGRILVLDRMAAVLRAYGPDGEHLGDWATRGEGPGELQRPMGLLRLPGDTVVVTSLYGSLSIFSTEGRYIRDVRLPLQEWGYMGAEGWYPTYTASGVAGRLEDGSWVAALQGVVAGEGGPTRERIALARFQEDGVGDTLVVLSGPELRVVHEERGYRLLGTHFPSRATAVAQDVHLHASEGRAFSFTTYAPDGRPVRIARLERPRTAVDGQLRDRWRTHRSQWWGASPEPGVPAGRLQELFEETPFPDSLPGLHDLVMDGVGNTWGRLFPQRAWDRPTHRFLVFDPEGVFLGPVDAPPGLRVLEIGESHVLGAWRDENGVDFVQLHRLEKPGA